MLIEIVLKFIISITFCISAYMIQYDTFNSNEIIKMFCDIIYGIGCAIVFAIVIFTLFFIYVESMAGTVFTTIVLYILYYYNKEIEV